MIELTDAERREVRALAADEDFEMSEDLYGKLYSYFNDNGEMPYGVAKARTGDPHQWIYDKMPEVARLFPVLETSKTIKKYINASGFLRTVAANLNNDKLSDADFRQFMRNSMSQGDEDYQNMVVDLGNEREKFLKAVLEKIEYYFDGGVRRCPDESEVREALAL